MTILIGVNHKLFLKRDFPSLSDPLGGSAGVTFSVMQRYMTAGFIPVWGTRKFVKAFSIESGQPIPVLLWTEQMKRQADGLMPQASGAWKKRIVGLIFLIALFALFLWLFVVGSSNVNNAKNQEAWIADPKPGDIVLATESSNGYVPQENRMYNLIVFKIEDIRGDSLIIRRGLQKEDVMEQYRVKNHNKLISRFDANDAAFSPTHEVYSLAKYREGDKRLQRITKYYEYWEDTPEFRLQDSILRHTDIIEPIFINRPKK